MDNAWTVMSLVSLVQEKLQLVLLVSRIKDTIARITSVLMFVKRVYKYSPNSLMALLLASIVKENAQHVQVL